MRCLKEKLGLLQVDQSCVAVTDGFKAIAIRDFRESVVTVGTDRLVDQTVALCLRSSLDLIRTVVGLDGTATSLLFLSPELGLAQVEQLMSAARAKVLLSDREDMANLSAQWKFETDASQTCTGLLTTWLMTTSGTTGLPKIVAHSFDSLTASITSKCQSVQPVWGLLYDASRFAGMQVVLQSLLSGGKLIAVDRQASFSEQIAQLARSGCSHLSATAAMWRKILMLPAAQHLALKQITLGGDIADARTLKALSVAWPDARITHIYASTEIGVGFFGS